MKEGDAMRRFKQLPLSYNVSANSKFNVTSSNPRVSLDSRRRVAIKDKKSISPLKRPGLASNHSVLSLRDNMKDASISVLMNPLDNQRGYGRVGGDNLVQFTFNNIKRRSKSASYYQDKY